MIGTEVRIVTNCLRAGGRDAEEKERLGRTTQSLSYTICTEGDVQRERETLENQSVRKGKKRKGRVACPFLYSGVRPGGGGGGKGDPPWHAMYGGASLKAVVTVVLTVTVLSPIVVERVQNVSMVHTHTHTHTVAEKERRTLTCVGGGGRRSGHWPMERSQFGRRDRPRRIGRGPVGAYRPGGG